MRNWKRKVYHLAVKRKFASKNWIRVRNKVLKRDNYRCQMCRVFYEQGNLGLTVHHIKPRPKGKSHMRNLISLCMKCHDIVEIKGLSRMQILKFDYKKYKAIPIKFKIIADKPDWHLWVYGGYSRYKIQGGLK